MSNLPPFLAENTPEIIWEHYIKTEFGNNIYIGVNMKTKEFFACSDRSPWFYVPADSQERVEQQIKFVLEAYKKYLSNLMTKVF